jgi:hypothetical protein
VFTGDGVAMRGIPTEIYELMASHIEKGAEFDVFQLFHKIARIDRLLDLKRATFVLSEEGTQQRVE